MDYEDFNLESFQFVDEPTKRGPLESLNRFLAKMMRPRVALMGSPVRRRKGVPSGHGTLLEDLYEAIGLYRPPLQGIISFHHSRLMLRNRVRLIVYYLSGGPLLGIFFGGWIWLDRIIRPITASHGYINSMLRIIWVLVIWLFMFVIVRIALRIASAVTNKNFAESICSMIVAYIVIDLSRDDILSDPRKRKVLVTRISDLARVTLLLPSRYASRDESNQEWLKKHFKHMQLYVAERARWAVVPTEFTLSDLRRDFYELATIYVDGSYGRFSWPPQELISERPMHWKERLFSGIPRFVGIVLPLILMGLLLWKPFYLKPIGVESNIIALILIAWLLLAIDAALKLGVVAGIANLAKEIKNLK